MKKNKNKISIFKRIGLIAIAFAIAIGSFFVNVQKNGHNHSLIASANETTTTYTFIGSNIYVPLWRQNSVPSNYYYVDNGLYMNKLYYDNNSLVVDITGSFCFVEHHNGSNDAFNYDGAILKFGSLTSSTRTYTTSISNFDTYSLRRIFSLAYHDNSIEYSDYSIFYYCQSSFNCNVYKVVLQHESLDVTGSGSTSHFNTITYYDVNDVYFKICFPMNDYYSGGVNTFSYRQYYITDSLSDNQIFQNGYQQGLADNQQNIYDNGYKAGQTVGEAIGFDKGLLQANDYSFTSLFGAVIDAPIKAFSGLFNFEILGVNLLDFFLGLLTFGVIIFVIKLLLGG